MALTKVTSGVRTIASSEVVTASIADDAVTLAKMAPGTDGNLISYDASGNPAAVATGSSGQVLTSQGAGSAPVFATVAPNITLGTEQVTTSGTSFDFTGIPSGVKIIRVGIFNVSTSSTSNWLIQIGGSGGVETTGYSSQVGVAGAGASSTTGFILTSALSAGAGVGGIVELMRVNSAGLQWLYTSRLAQATIHPHGGAGYKGLTAELDRLRFTTTNGTDTFDSGNINIQYAG